MDSDRARLIYDPLLEERFLVNSENFMASLNRSLTEDDGPDVKRLWFLYTKNRADLAEGELIEVEVCSACGDKKDLVIGNICADLDSEDVCWLSFGGMKLHEDPKLIVVSHRVKHIKNAHHRASIRLLLPRYEGNPKHRKDPYYDKKRGEHVAPMPLDDEQAQCLLLTSLEYCGDRWAHHKSRDEYYRFKLTHNDRDIYHGFKVDPGETPDEVIKHL